MEPETTTSASILHVRKGGVIFVTVRWSAAVATGMGTRTMSPAIELGLRAVVVAAVRVAIVGAASASTLRVVAGRIVVVVVVASHHRHHLLHLGKHGGFARLHVGFTTLEAAGDIGCWSRTAVCSRRDWLDLLLSEETFKNEIGHGGNIGLSLRLMVHVTGSGQRVEVSLCLAQVPHHVIPCFVNEGLLIPET